MRGILRPLPSKEAHRETIEKIHEVSRERTYSDGRLRELVKRELTRYGYNVKALSELLNIRQAEVRAFLHGQLPPGRAEDLHHQLLAAGIPLGNHFPPGSREL